VDIYGWFRPKITEEALCWMLLETAAFENDKGNVMTDKGNVMTAIRDAGTGICILDPEHLIQFHNGTYRRIACKAAIAYRRPYRLEASHKIMQRVETPDRSARFTEDLPVAAFAGDVASVRLLLDNGADVNARSVCFGTPLTAASYCGNIQVMKLLLERGAAVSDPTYGNSMTPSTPQHTRQARKLCSCSSPTAQTRMPATSLASSKLQEIIPMSSSYYWTMEQCPGTTPKRGHHYIGQPVKGMLQWHGFGLTMDMMFMKEPYSA
jgi:hypothetical protein